MFSIVSYLTVASTIATKNGLSFRLQGLQIIYYVDQINCSSSSPSSSSYLKEDGHSFMAALVASHHEVDRAVDAELGGNHRRQLPSQTPTV